MTRATAMRDLFAAFGASRNEEQASLYLNELTRSGSCADCAEIAVENLTRSSRRLPALSQVLDEVREVVNSDVHTSHIVNPQLAPRAETWWRSEAVKVILPKVGGDRDLAALVAAQLWFNDVEADLGSLTEELGSGAYVLAVKRFTAGKDVKALAEAAFRRARWVTEHAADEVMPREIVNLETR